jgi:hypothetical protein
VDLLPNIQTVFEAHLTAYSVGTGTLSLGVKHLALRLSGTVVLLILHILGWHARDKSIIIIIIIIIITP